jgi:gluconate 2-dehydrogenase
MKKRVVAYRKLPAAVLQILEAQFDVTVADADTEQAAFMDALAGAHGTIGNKLKRIARHRAHARGRVDDLGGI